MEATLKSREEILAAGKVEIKVKRSGTIQFQEFAVKRVKSAFGEYPVLFLDKFVDASECERVAREADLPVQTKNGVFYPRGKSSRDFVGL